jgi:hypothetical protein
MEVSPFWGKWDCIYSMYMLYYTPKREGGSMHKKLDPIEKKIAGVKEELMTIGEMRPGSLTYQYQRPKEKKGGFYQISYTYRMKSKTEYVKAQFVQDFKRQIATFKRFKKLMQQWVDLAIRYSQIKTKLAKEGKIKLS